MSDICPQIDLLNKNAGATTQDESLVEAEYERIGNRSEDVKEEQEAQLQDEEEDGILSNFSESLTSKQMACVDLSESDLSRDENLDLDGNQVVTHYTDVQKTIFDAHCEHEAANRIETSAITGVGLKELLSLISEKLSARTLVQRKTFDEPFDRKWRPQSHNLEYDRPVEQ